MMLRLIKENTMSNNAEDTMLKLNIILDIAGKNNMINPTNKDNIPLIRGK